MAFVGVCLDIPKRMAYGQLRFWGAGKLAYESEAWPQDYFFIEKRQKLDVLTKHRLQITRIRRNLFQSGK